MRCSERRLLADPLQFEAVGEPLAALLCEFRSDGHVAALLSEGLDSCEAHIMLAATGRTSRQVIQPNRGWTDEEWDAAQERLRERGLLDDEGKLSEKGSALRQTVEDRTDLLALAPWRQLGEERHNRLLQLVHPLSARIIEQSGLPLPNPLGLSWP